MNHLHFAVTNIRKLLFINRGANITLCRVVPMYKRTVHNDRNFQKHKQFYIEQSKRSTRNYAAAVAVLMLGLTYASVPLYGIFCQMTGFGGTTQHTVGDDKIKIMRRNPNRSITVKFNSDVSSKMSWEFKPQQNEVRVVPGETALAFYTATNPTNKPVIGVSTYNVVPFEAGQYFNKIQCFCFEEQLLNPHEQVDMPVFFYIDPEFADDPNLEGVDEVILSYTFYEAKDGVKIPIPSFLKRN